MSLSESACPPSTVARPALVQQVATQHRSEAAGVWETSNVKRNSQNARLSSCRARLGRSREASEACWISRMRAGARSFFREAFWVQFVADKGADSGVLGFSGAEQPSSGDPHGRHPLTEACSRTGLARPSSVILLRHNCHHQTTTMVRRAQLRPAAAPLLPARRAPLPSSRPSPRRPCSASRRWVPRADERSARPPHCRELLGVDWALFVPIRCRPKHRLRCRKERERS